MFHFPRHAAQPLNILSRPPAAGVRLLAFHTVTRRETADARFINFITITENTLCQRQIEKRGRLCFMRAKRRTFV